MTGTVVIRSSWNVTVPAITGLSVGVGDCSAGLFSGGGSHWVQNRTSSTPRWHYIRSPKEKERKKVIGFEDRGYEETRYLIGHVDRPPLLNLMPTRSTFSPWAPACPSRSHGLDRASEHASASY